MNSPTPPVRLFSDDDRLYLAWLATNVHGWVINAYRVPDHRYLILHKGDLSHHHRHPSLRIHLDRRPVLQDLRHQRRRHHGMVPNSRRETPHTMRKT